MTPAQIIAGALVPGTHSVLFLGCFESRVTLYSQQVRALNLVDAVLAEGLVRRTGKVAIVGGGAAGVTAAAAFALEATELTAIDVFEKQGDVLDLQRGSGRYLHPHNYDWPADGTAQTDAGLPIMNWNAGPAGEVQKTLRTEFDALARGSGPINLRREVSVSGVTPFELAQVRVDVASAPHASDVYDVVILAIGFGLEKCLEDAETPSYWSPSALGAPILTGAANNTIFVSGNGDGGLVDFMLAAFNGLPHEAVNSLVCGLDLGPALAELQVIEEEAWLPSADVDLFDAYERRVLPLLPAAAIADVADRLRPNVRVTLHTTDERLFKRTSALLNRFGVYLAFVADRNRSRNAIALQRDVNFVGAVPRTGPITLTGSAPFSPWRRFLRLGPDSASNLRPFDAMVARLPASARRPTRDVRAATPQLTPTAAARFEPYRKPPPTFESPAATVVANAEVCTLQLSSRGATRVWIAGTGVAELASAWRIGKSLVIECAVEAQAVDLLAPAIARLCVHASSARLMVEDRRRWEDALYDAAHTRSMPENLDIVFSIDDAPTLVADAEGHEHSIAEFIEALNAQLDADVFARLHDLLYDSLGRTPPNDTGWPIETHLRLKLWRLWEQWRTLVNGDDAARRRFLLLLTYEADTTVPDVNRLVRVGPRTLRPNMLKAVIFALAFAVASEHRFEPTGLHPGNVRADNVTGHACGVSWIEGRDLNPGVVDLPWTTSIVLLSELKAVFELLQGEPRLDQMVGGPLLIGDVGAAERPLVLGADHVFLSALEQGEAALGAYLKDIFARRTGISLRSLTVTP